MTVEAAAGRRVSIVLHTFDRGGSGRVAAYLACGLAERGTAVELVVLCRGGDAERLATTIAGPDVPIRYLGRLGRARPLDLLRGLPRLARRLHEDQPDVIVAAANNVALVTMAAVRLAGLKRSRLFVKTTNPIAFSRHRGLARAIRRWSYRAVFARAAGVWTLSPDETREMAAAFPRFATLFRDVANPYVTAEMLSPRMPATVPHCPGRQVIAVARLTRQKRLDRLIRAFAQLRSQDAELLILGEGEERTALATLTHALGLAGRVSMPGHVLDVTPFLQAADLLVLTSDYEGLPAAVLEAMAVNLPVLSTDCFPAARALLAHAEGCAIVADPAPPALAALIDRHLAMARPTTLRTVAERFSIENGVRSHLLAMTGEAI